MRSSKWIVWVILALLPVGLASAAKPVDPVNQTKDGLAVQGHDVVAYFTESQPTKGNSAFEHLWRGAKWRFASSENLATFVSDPEKYAPQYGGYCAYAVSKGKTAGISPKAWSIIDGKLYLNNRWAKGSFKKNTTRAIERADEIWPNLPKKPLQKQ